jgi:hypothetical protein
MTSATTSSGPVQITTLHKFAPLVLFALCAAVAGGAVVSDPAGTWPNLLLDGFYIATLPLSAVFFLATQRLTGARWSAGLRRVPEAWSAALWPAAILLAVVFLGRETLFAWARPGAFAHESAIAGKVQYLKVPFVAARIAISLGLWVLFAFLFRRGSLAQDRNAHESLLQHERLNRLSVFFVLLFALTFTASVFDWIISLDTTWFSTMFAVLAFAGTFVQGIAAVTLATVILWERGYLRDVVGEAQFHDLGKMLFAFSVFWGYIWTCQYLLIWYTNIPEEVTHYMSRTNGSWVYLFALNFILNWLVPFTVLLSARSKTKPRVLKTISIVLLVGHWLDLYMMIMPAVRKEPHIGLVEITTAIGWAALIYWFFLRALLKAPLVPQNDPVLRGELLIQEHHHHLHGTAAMAHHHPGGERP